MTQHRSALERTSVGEAMSRGVLTCPLETPLSAVAELMATHRVHSVVGFGDVTEDDTLLWGLISDFDLVAKAALGDLDGLTAGGTALTEVVSVSPEESLQRAAQLMAEHRVSHLVVADPGSDTPVGVISTLDIAAVLGGLAQKPRQRGATRVEQLMTTQVITASPDMSLKRVAALLVRHSISGLPVVSDGKLLGVVSEADIAAREQGPGAGADRSMLGWILGNEREDLRSKLAARTAGEAMTTPAVTIEAWRSVSAAASLMLERSVKRLPVLKQQKLVGIITRADLVRAFARADDEIEEDIRRGVLLRTPLRSTRFVEVDVREGIVTLRGKIDAARVAELLKEETERIPGVVEVRSELEVER
jgi:CBS domain-containing protein